MFAALVRYFSRHHVGLIALFVATGGTAYAATALPPNSVGTRQLRRHAVTFSKIDPRAQKALRGRTGRAGRTGRPGPPGQVGPSDAYVGQTNTGGPPNNSSVTVPAGDYVASGGCTATRTGAPGQTTPTFGQADALLTSSAVKVTPNPLGDPGTFGASASVPDLGGMVASGTMGPNLPIGTVSLSDSGAFSLPNGGTITQYCYDDFGSQHPSSYSLFHLTAIRVANLHAPAS